MEINTFNNFMNFYELYHFILYFYPKFSLKPYKFNEKKKNDYP